MKSTTSLRYFCYISLKLYIKSVYSETMKSDEMEFSSPFTMNSSKLSAITDFLFLRKTSQALYNGMMKNKRATDPRNGIQMAASCSSGILKTMYRWPMATKSRGCIPGVWSVRFQNQTMSPPCAPKKLSKMYHSPLVPGGSPWVSRGSTPEKANDKCIMKTPAVFMCWCTVAWQVRL